MASRLKRKLCADPLLRERVGKNVRAFYKGIYGSLSLRQNEKLKYSWIFEPNPRAACLSRIVPFNVPLKRAPRNTAIVDAICVLLFNNPMIRYSEITDAIMTWKVGAPIYTEEYTGCAVRCTRKVPVVKIGLIMSSVANHGYIARSFIDSHARALFVRVGGTWMLTLKGLARAQRVIAFHAVSG